MGVLKIFFILSLLSLILNAKIINIDVLAKEASLLNKHLFVFLHKTDCGYCDAMIEFTLKSKQVTKFLKEHFIYKHIDVYKQDTIIYNSKKLTGREFAKQIGYDFYPTSLFFDKDAKIIFIEVGYIDSKELPNEKRFLNILKYIDSSSYKTMELEEYNF